MKSISRHSVSSGQAPRLLCVLILAAFGATSNAAGPAWRGVAAQAHDPRDAVHVGPLRAGTPVRVTVSLKVRDKARLDALTEQLMAGAPGVQPLSAAEFNARHAPTAAQAQAVADYLRAKGFINIEIADNHMMVSADGLAGTVKDAFDADLHEYNVHGRSAFANVTAAKVPAQLDGIVLGVGGLQTVHMAHATSQAAAVATTPSVTQPQASIKGNSLTAFATVYGASGLPVGSNATIGIIMAGATAQTITDLKNFASSAGYPVPPISVTTINGGSSDTSEVAEWNMDSQASLATAGGTVKSMTLYNTASFSDADLSAAYNRAMSDNKAKVISVSLGGCETNSSSLSTNNQTFQAAVAQGQTFVVSSGDSGAYECGATAGKAQSWPAASPYVMAIGGTTLSINNDNTWAGETAWSCTSASACQKASLGGAGGGPSLTQTASTAQRNSGVLGTSTARGLPDISFDANPSSGGLILINGFYYQWGGTSLAAPIFAGLWARIQSAHGNTLAFPAATLYGGAATHPAWLHDVTLGNQGYAAGTGWDYASGYGSLQIGNFATAFSTALDTPASLISNGTFESGATGWTATAGVICTNAACTPTESARTGTGYAWLNGYGATHTDTLSQTMAIPAGNGSATLSFYLHIDTAETEQLAYDTLKVQVLNSAGTVLATLATYSNLDAAGGYALRTFSLNSYIGQTVTLRFLGAEDSNLQTSFVIDDLSLTAQ